MVNPINTPLLERYQRLLELSHDLASTLDLPILLNRIVHAATDLCQAEAASILLYDDINQELYFEAASNLKTPDMKGLVVPVDASIAGWILTKQEPVIINDVSKDPRHFKQIGEATDIQTTSLLGVPLITNNRVVGVLEAINKRSGVFSLEDQELLMALGAQAAVAIVNARLFQQSDLISEFVHELRTPLTSINAASHLLMHPGVTSEQTHTILQTMQQEITRLTKMTSSFLELALLESGRSQFDLEVINLNHLLEEIADVFQLETNEKNQKFKLDIYQAIPPVIADYDKIKQVVLNLLNNAKKYTPNGGDITLAARYTSNDVIISVDDSGLGIPPDSLPHVFDKFYRVPGSEQVSQGTGLGLSICQRIIESLNGRIDVESQVNAGSRFSIYLPRTSAESV